MGKYNWGIVGTGWIGGEMAQTLSDKQLYHFFHQNLMT